MYKHIHVRYPLFFSDFNEDLIFCTYFVHILYIYSVHIFEKYSNKILENTCGENRIAPCGRMDGQMDRRTGGEQT